MHRQLRVVLIRVRHRGESDLENAVAQFFLALYRVESQVYERIVDNLVQHVRSRRLLRHLKSRRRDSFPYR